MKINAKLVQISGEEGNGSGEPIPYTSLLIYPKDEKPFKFLHINDNAHEEKFVLNDLSFLMTIGEYI
jgi:hypothetical protein